MCYHTEFGRSALTVAINREPPKLQWEALGFHILVTEGVADRKKHASPHMYYFAERGPSALTGV